jgi:Fic family protein
MPRLPKNKPPQELIWRQPGWPKLHYDSARVAAAIALARRAQGAMEGKLAAIGFEQRQEIAAETWTQEALSTAAIEGERLDLVAVRSSIARRLGVAQTPSTHTPRHVDGLLDVMDDAVTQAAKPLTHDRLHAWQAALFPTGYSGMSRIRVGGYREHAEPMQIVSGRIGRETVHYEAPPSAAVFQEMEQFLVWLNGTHEAEGLAKAAIAHLWFETIHPFEDGNGRVGRAIVDLVLARDAGQPSRVLRISQQLLARRSDYYAQLERAQHGPLDVTEWVVWFTQQVQAGFEMAASVVNLSLAKAMFWNEHRAKDLSPRQRKAINALLDAGPGGFEGGMSTRKYENLTGAARATASRDLIDLAALGLLVQLGAGRATRYQLQIEGFAPG